MVLEEFLLSRGDAVLSLEKNSYSVKCAVIPIPETVKDFCGKNRNFSKSAGLEAFTKITDPRIMKDAVNYEFEKFAKLDEHVIRNYARGEEFRSVWRKIAPTVRVEELDYAIIRTGRTYAVLQDNPASKVEHEREAVKNYYLKLAARKVNSEMRVDQLESSNLCILHLDMHKSIVVGQANVSNVNLEKERFEVFYPNGEGLDFYLHNVDELYDALLCREWAVIYLNCVLTEIFKKKEVSKKRDYE